jgi:hypothetical protein
VIFPDSLKSYKSLYLDKTTKRKRKRKEKEKKRKRKRKELITELFRENKRNFTFRCSIFSQYLYYVQLFAPTYIIQFNCYFILLQVKCNEFTASTIQTIKKKGRKGEQRRAHTLGGTSMNTNLLKERTQRY